jgi:predicted nucleic acid-binding protein
VDASVGIKLFIPDPLSSKARELFAYLAYPQTEIFVPDLFYIECANTIWKYVRAGRYAAADAPADLAALKALRLRVVSTADLMEEAVSIGLTYGISAYDGSYVALSRQVSAPVLTLDLRLVTALAASPYDVRSFNDFSLPPLS